MAAVGRGRGRGRGLLARDLSNEDTVKQVGGGDTNGKIVENGNPGNQDKNKTTAEDGIKDIQETLDRLTLDISEEDVANIYDLAENVASSDDHLKQMTKLIYKKCVSDREFAKTGAYICDKLTGIEANGTKFRSCLLSLIQVDFKEKDKLQQGSSQLLNNFSFMCQVFHIMRTAGGEVFKPLIGPLFEYINLIVESKVEQTDGFECLNEQLQAIGQDLEQNDREKMDLLMEKVRNLIIRNGASAPVRCALLEIFECHCRGWKELHNEITRFYCDTMMDIITDY